mmetsp:Transcript_10080/g.30160  ORF Transcript_10080/g.30160 Transcript_10080/m.30160 type:complete len:233 (-) Transcript_10080:100-798(-)
MSSPTGTPVARSMISTLMGASHLALSTSFTRYLGAKLTLQRRWGLCSHSTHCGSRHPRLRQSCRKTSCKSRFSTTAGPYSGAGSAAIDSAATCCISACGMEGLMRRAKGVANCISRARTYSSTGLAGMGCSSRGTLTPRTSSTMAAELLYVADQAQLLPMRPTGLARSHAFGCKWWPKLFWVFWQSFEVPPSQRWTGRSQLHNQRTTSRQSWSEPPFCITLRSGAQTTHSFL